MSERCCSIDYAKNGFTVRIRDPKRAKKNSKSTEPAPYVDPDVEYVFDSVEGVIKFLTEALPKSIPPDEYSSTFDKIAKESE